MEIKNIGNGPSGSVPAEAHEPIRVLTGLQGPALHRLFGVGNGPFHAVSIYDPTQQQMQLVALASIVPSDGSPGEPPKLKLLAPAATPDQRQQIAELLHVAGAQVIDIRRE